MTIAILLLAALVLMITMFVLTLGVNELEKKGAELSAIIKARYALKQPAKKGGAAPPAAAPIQGLGGISIPPTTNRSPGRA
jgi:hypothetical protein